MQIPYWAEIGTFILLIVIILGVLSRFLIIIFCEIDDRLLMRRIRTKLSSDDIKFGDYKNLLKTRRMTDKRGLNILELLKAQIDFSAAPSEPMKMKERVDALVSEFLKKEPFSDFPEEIREALDLAKNNSNKPEIIDNLAEKLNLYIRRQSKSELWSRVMTYLGTFVGIAGLAWGFLK